MKLVRKNIAEFIASRDNIYDISYKDIIMTNGAGSAIRGTFEAIINSEKDAVMTPIPNFPLYPSLIALLNTNLVGYELNEEDGWSLDLENIRSQYKIASDKGLIPKTFVITNPGNPAGNILSKVNIEDIVKFCFNHKMKIFADEVYQNNVHNETKQF